jgi:hypothetical protein
MTQETPRKYTKPTNVKKYLRRDPRLERRKDDAETNIRMVEIINWKQVAQDTKEWKRET